MRESFEIYMIVTDAIINQIGTSNPNVGNRDFAPNDKLSKMGLDSLDIMEVIMAVENKTLIYLDWDDINGIETFGDICCRFNSKI